jgi:hypothetical protein
MTQHCSDCDNADVRHVNAKRFGDSAHCEPGCRRSCDAATAAAADREIQRCSDCDNASCSCNPRLDKQYGPASLLSFSAWLPFKLLCFSDCLGQSCSLLKGQ